MALDKQKILNELGSVVNQLQSADCGCMGKLFSNSSGYEGNAMSNPQSSCGGCRQGCCHRYGGYNVGHGHGYIAPCAGEPCAANNMCMVQCNAPKPYADTFSYMNRNLMQPIVKEDIKSISPANTINNPKLGAAISPANRNYGQHTQAMAKYHEMFPGVTGGDLGFDPMSIAIQMNPANQQKAAVDIMRKMMNGDRLPTALDTSANSAHMKTTIAGANAAVANISQNIPRNNQQALHGQQGTVLAPIAQIQQGNTYAITPNQQQVFNTNQIPPQQVLTASTGAPAISQEQSPQPIPAQYEYQTYTPQQIVDPNSGSVMPTPNLPPLYEGASDVVHGQIQQQQKQENRAPQPTYDLDRMVIKDPIFPVDSTKYQDSPSMKRQKYFEYNTLGQPVVKLPAQLYQPPVNSLPQTLSPQPVTRLRNDYARFNVKMTESKTSLMGNRTVGRTPSKKQLQQIYNQYKGSQSYTEQNIKNPPRDATCSERSLNLRQTPLERVGGDTAANNSPMTNQMLEKGYPQSIEQIGDTAISNKPHGDYIPIKETPTKDAKSRNGLQDKVFTTYTGPTAWSFHGDQNAPLSAGYRFRNRVY